MEIVFSEIAGLLLAAAAIGLIGATLRQPSSPSSRSASQAQLHHAIRKIHPATTPSPAPSATYLTSRQGSGPASSPRLPAYGARRASMSTSTKAPTANAVTPIVVRAGRRSGGK